ncbi:MAG: TonB-dependent receptor domain-containing protein [Bryobacteraceae bacterium]
MLRPYPFLTLFLCSVLWTSGSEPLFAQASSTASIRGELTDPEDRSIPNAELTLIGLATQSQRRFITNSDGLFLFTALPPGSYRMRIEREGFQSMEIPEISVSVSERASLRLRMRVATVFESVDVVTDVSLIPDSATVSTVIGPRMVANLPLNGRSFQSLLMLTPGVNLDPSTTLGPTGQFSINGQRGNANYFVVDGVSANVGVSTGQVPGHGGSGSIPGFTVLGGTNNLVSVDALQEFSIQTSTYSSEFGRTPGGQVSLVTRSGTSQYHGTLFQYFRNDKLDANDFFANRNGLSRPPLRQNQFGGVLGGPVRLPGLYDGRNRTFFFLSHESLRLRQPQVTETTTASLSARQSAPPAIRPLLDALPLPTGADLPNGLAQFSASYSVPSTLDATSIRLDHSASSRVALFGRFNHAPSSRTSRRPGAVSAVSDTFVDTDTATVGANVTFRPNFLWDFRHNYSRVRGGSTHYVDAFGGATPPPRSALLPDFAGPNSYAIVNFTGTPHSISMGPEAGNRQVQHNMVTTGSWIRSGHTVKFGMDFRRLISTLSADAQTQYRPTYNFQGITGALNQTLTAAILNVVERSNLYFDNLSLFTQDDWRVTRRLTINYGLRYELNPAPGGSDAARHPWTVQGLSELSTATVAPPGTKLYGTSTRNFAPRLGAALQLRQSAAWSTVLRGGYGLFYDVGFGVVGNAAGAYPLLRTKRLPRGTTFPLTPDQAAPLPVDAPPPYDLIRAFAPDVSTPRTHQFSFTVDQELGAGQVLSLSYVGARGRQLLRQESISNVSPTIRLLQLTTNGDRSDYNALQIQLQRKAARNLTALVSYTFSKSLDTSSSDAGFLPRSDRVPPVQDRGPSAFDVRHAFSGAVSYDLPSRFGNRGLRMLFGGWGTDALVYVRSATPINPIGFRSTEFGFVELRPDLVSGVPLYVADANAPGGRRINVDPLPNSAQRGPFLFSPEARQGNLGRNSFRGFAFSQVDFSVRRQFAVTEKLRLDVRGEFFNLFNTPNFANPSNDLGSPNAAGVFVPPPTFGVATAMMRSAYGGLSPIYQVGGPRSVQLVLRLRF